jgi:radical SAM protein with 4Fe4S-binding SPASM domain
LLLQKLLIRGVKNQMLSKKSINLISKGLTCFIPSKKYRRALRGKIKNLLWFLKTRNLFSSIHSSKSKYKTTKKFLRFIEIETFSFCNRQCYFCPNSKVDRRSKNEFMPEETYISILKSLQEIDYDGYVSYSRYNEPLADRIILTRIKQARQYLPNAFLYSHTNGDYLNRQYLFDLIDSGLDMLRVQCYLSENESFNEHIIFEKMKKIIEKLQMDYEIISSNDNYYAIKLKIPSNDDFELIIESMNFSVVGANRAGSVNIGKDNTDRVQACWSPFRNMYIDYDGSVFPCCNLRHDLPQHRHLIMGNVNEYNIIDIFTGAEFANIRKKLVHRGEINISPCKSCNAIPTMCDNAFDFIDYKPYIKKSGEHIK